jgi:hypothetical protein
MQEQPYDYDKLTQATTQLKQVYTYTEGYVVFLDEYTLNHLWPMFRHRYSCPFTG